ncbi:hypothetical protein EJB05_23543, partial [Eragrostis curvula]
MFIVAIVVPVSVIAVAVAAFFLSNLPGTEFTIGGAWRLRAAADVAVSVSWSASSPASSSASSAARSRGPTNASFQAANSREENEVVRLKDAVITGGTLPCWNTLHGNAPIVIAQGGFSGLFPDSSDMAYEFAAKWTPDSVLYCDLRLTKDGKGICLPYLDMGNCPTISTLYPLEKKSYVVKGVPTWGWFSVDYTTAQLRHVYLGGQTKLVFRFLDEDAIEPSTNMSYVAEILAYVDNAVFAVDGILTEFPTTPTEAIGCFINVNRSNADHGTFELVIVLTQSFSG